MKIFLLFLWLFYLGWVNSLTDSLINWVLFVLVGLGWTYWGVSTYWDLCKKNDNAKNPINAHSFKPTATKIVTPKVESHQANNFVCPSYRNDHLLNHRVKISTKDKTETKIPTPKIELPQEREELGLKVSTKYKTATKKHYTFNEIEVSAYTLKYPHLTKNQRKVKILGGALVKRVKSKKRAAQILINQYGFKENTAEYAVGYEGYHDW